MQLKIILSTINYFFSFWFHSQSLETSFRAHTHIYVYINKRFLFVYVNIEFYMYDIIQYIQINTQDYDDCYIHTYYAKRFVYRSVNLYKM